MNINFYLSTTVPSGGTFVLLEYARRLQKRGYDVICYCIAIPPKFTHEDIKEKIYNGFPVANAREIKHLYIMQKELKEVRQRYPELKYIIINSTNVHKIRCADIGIAGSWQAAYFLAEDDKIRLKKAYLIQGYENWDRFGRGEKSYNLKLTRICISTQLKKMVEQYTQENVDYVIHDGIDLNFFNNKKKYYRQNNKITCTMFYTFGARKGCDIGIEAFKGVMNKHPEMRLVMFGRPEKPDIGTDFEYIQNASKDEVLNIYKHTDIFIWPTIFEGWGMTPIEAMACECAVVGSNVASMSEIGVDGYNALLGTPGNVQELEYNIERVVDDISLQKTLSVNGRKSVEEFDWEKSVDKLEKVLKDI